MSVLPSLLNIIIIIIRHVDVEVFCYVAYRYTVGKYAPVVRELRGGDFDPKEKFWTRLPMEGSKFAPQHQSVDFRWKDYCPMVFRC